MGPYGEAESPRPTSTPKRGSEDEGIMASASLEVLPANNAVPHGPALYEVVYTRGGWIWRTSHRFRDWLSLKERLRTELGTRNLPDDNVFPQKEDMSAMVSKLLTSCQGCREAGGPVGILEERREGLQAYFAEILAEHRDLWDGSEDIKTFFFPGPPTSYSAALSRRRSEQLKEEKLRAKEAASASSILSSSLKSTFSSLFETTPSPVKPSLSSSSSLSLSSTARPSVDAGTPASAAKEDRAMGDAAAGAPSTPSMMNRFSSKMPSLRDFLFEGPPPSSSQSSSSRHDATGGGRYKLPSASTSCRTPSESETTDPDGGISEGGGSKHSIRE